MRKISLIGVTCLAVFAAGALAQMQPLAPGPEVEKLHFLKGDWKIHVKIDPSEWGPGGESHGTASFTLLSGVWMHQQTQADMPGMGPFTGIGMMTWDAAKGDYVSYWFDNFGAFVAEYRGKVEGNKLVFTRESEWEGQKVWEKHYYTLGDANVVEFVMDISHDGTNYYTGMRIRYSR